MTSNNTNIFFFILSLSFSMSLQAQQIWKDYIIGRPMMDYCEAKKATAKEWGINYEVIFGGCVISDQVSADMERYNKENEAYFNTLESRFGKDWMRYFTLDVWKKVNIAHAKDEDGIWIDPILGKPYMAHFKAKKAVAKKWGIHYKPEFLGCEVSEETQAEVVQRIEKSSDYIHRLNARFGDDWQKEFDREVKFELAKAQQANIPQPESSLTSNDTWVDFVMGKPSIPHFDAKKAIAKEWGINYHAEFAGCKRTKKMMAQKKKITAKNEKYFAQLNKIYGQDWKTHFNRAVQKLVAQKRLEAAAAEEEER